MSDPAVPPAVWLTLPDGQEVRARLHARRWTPSGWRYRVSVPLWSVTADQYVEPVAYTVWVPAGGDEYVRPVDGQDYGAVPTEERPPSDPYLAPPPPGVEQRWAWTIERPGGTSGVVLHEHGCVRAPADGPELSLDDAVTAYARPGARVCGECAAAEVLDRL
ncbi:DUF6233 domain-containing protein [Streptomyces sp. NPDC058394]|uniref:DUF6233 domain-containing protein n=1 Tax=Streptomyces sp. NPDC058394 TaxID=3346477 RepID=UPI003650873D